MSMGKMAATTAVGHAEANNFSEPVETDAMLEQGQMGGHQGPPSIDGDPAASPLQQNDGSGGHNTLIEARAHSSSPRRIPLFERASARWWNPQFASPTLETQYWKCSFPLLRDRFRSGLIYILICCLSWMLFLWTFEQAHGHHWLIALLLSALCFLMFWFTSCSAHYQRFYLPTSFLCTFLLCLTTLFIFSSTDTFMGPLASMATSIQVILLVYAVIPFPLYLCIISCGFYSFFFELLASPSSASSSLNSASAPTFRPGTKATIHICVHLLGIHLYILTQVRQRKTFLKVGQSLLARKDLELETQFKDHMIQSVMPKKVADELLKETSELRRPSASLESHSNCRTSNAIGGGRSSAAESTVGLMSPNGRLSSGGGVPNVRKFRPFTMNLMNEVSILFADIAGFTKMASNKSADELVNLLNDLFGRFDYLCGRCNLEKISTLGDCYYCVAGCPEPRPDHAKCCVEMGLAMIIAIRQFDLDRGQSVNMRVGIHTGKVMCGMVGTKRFKFDVFSNDVTLANEMESTGVAGRVHISGKTAEYLDGAYILEEAAAHQGMKTYFIAGRSKEFESASGQFMLNNTISDSDSARDGLVSGESGGPYTKASFRKKLVDKLRTIQTNSLPPVSRGATTTTTSQSQQQQQQLMMSSTVGGSLRMRLLDRSLDHHHRGESVPLNTGSAQMLASIGETNGPNPEEKIPQQNRLVDDTRKSASLQMLAHGDGALPPMNSPANEMVSTEIGDGRTKSCSERNGAKIGGGGKLSRQQSSTTDWHTSERIGGKISAELAHESSANNSGGRGSRSSGLQDVGSEAGHSTASLAALDTAISHHHNAASLTRFDTDHRDFDQRLAQVIHGADGSFAKGFWMHQDSLNRWTLNFNQRDIENEYRAHFAAGDSSEKHSSAAKMPTSGIEKHRQLSTQLQRVGLHSSHHSAIATASRSNANKRQQRPHPQHHHRAHSRRRPRYRYSGVFIDIFVSAFIFLVCTLLFLLQPRLSLSLPFLLYISLASLFLVAVIVLVGLPLLSRRPILPWLHQWAPRHVLGALLIALPVGVALFNMPICLEMNPKNSLCINPGQLVVRLLYSYILLLALFAHCNFSQLGAWPKTGQALAVATIFLLSTWFCQHNLDKLLAQDSEATKNVHAQLATSKFASILEPPNAINSSHLTSCNRTQPPWTVGRFGSPLFIWELVLDVALAVVLVAFLNYQFEAAFRMSFFGDVQARRDTAKMQLVRDQADWLLNNIIPAHAVESLKTNTKYSENHKLTAVMFASITNWHEMYEENFEGGREFLRVLNEVIGDFDELLDRAEFGHVEKIKTIGPCYMAASGLNPERRRLSLHPYEHLYQLMEFAIGLQNALAFFNQDMDKIIVRRFNRRCPIVLHRLFKNCLCNIIIDLLNFEFECKIGLNIGPVTAGVIGTTKLYYDIWGDTVNIASRMYQTGVKNRIQVSSYTRDLLIDRYDFEYRDRIQVKGVDGGMETFLLVGRKGEGPLTFPFDNK